MTKIRFWGVRGSVPSPLTGTDVRNKIHTALTKYKQAGHPENLLDFFKESSANPAWGTYGGNTSCVEVVSDGARFILDMGTGIRPLGNSLIGEMLKNKGLEVVFLLSHLHWDHIQGLPFFAPLFANKETGIKNGWLFYGGTDWQKTAEACMRGQMNPPLFPVSWAEIQKMTHKMSCYDVHDRISFEPALHGPIVTCRKLNHPQETYGWRIHSSKDKVVVYTTDNEPFDPRYPDPPLLELAKNADVWITDCQYTQDVYNGIVGGVPRHGWGHSYPEAVAATAVQAGVKKVVLFHHDPASNDEKIESIQKLTQALIYNAGGFTEVIAAYEELELSI